VPLLGQQAQGVLAHAQALARVHLRGQVARLALALVLQEQRALVR